MIKLSYLADQMHVAEVLARWHYDQWRDLIRNWSYEDALSELRSHDRRLAVPTTIVALDDQRPVGSVSLIPEDLPELPPLTPWLASLYVAPTHRGQGVGSQLVERILSDAQSLGLPRVHLFTDDASDFYVRLGWRLLERFRYYETPVDIFCYDIA